MVEINATTPDAGFFVESRPNASLSRWGTVCLFTIIALCALVIAMGFALIGAWPVILFTLAVLLGLSFGFQYVWHRAGDYERLTVDDGRLCMEASSDGQVRRHEFNAHWVRVVMEQMPDGDCRRLGLCVHGREFDFGRHLCAEKKLEVGQLLKARLGSGFGTPHIGGRV